MRRAIGALLLAALAACGGAGSDDKEEVLYVNYSYGSYDATVLTAAGYSPYITGLNGKSPHCELVSGSLPPGMGLSGCTVTGTPTQPGFYAATLRLGVKDYKGTVSASITINVKAPVIQSRYYPYSTSDDWSWGVNEAPKEYWKLSEVYFPNEITYSIVAGRLPNGLSLLPDGRVTGLTYESGVQTFDLSVKVQRNGQQYTIPATTVSLNVTAPTAYYVEDGNYGNGTPKTSCCNVNWGVPFSASLRSSYAGPGTVSYTVIDPLPAGVNLDPNTGAISGTLDVSTPASFSSRIEQRIVESGGRTTTGIIGVGFNPTLYTPLADTYPYQVQRGQAVEIKPGAMATPRPGETWHFTLTPWYNYVGFWLSIDPATGTVSGTAPSQSSAMYFKVTATVTRNGGTETYTLSQDYAFYVP